MVITRDVFGYAAWEGSPMRTKTIPRYPVLAAQESAQANAVEVHENADVGLRIAEAVIEEAPCAQSRCHKRNAE